VNAIARRGFLVFWWLLHVYAVTVMAIAMFEKTMLLDAPLARLWGIGWAIAHPVTSL
jgi:hypothetical protein